MTRHAREQERRRLAFDPRRRARRKAAIDRGTCQRKVRHRTETEAKLALRSMREADKLILGCERTLRPYPCPQCDGWHLGNWKPYEQRLSRWLA